MVCPSGTSTTFSGRVLGLSKFSANPGGSRLACSSIGAEELESVSGNRPWQGTPPLAKRSVGGLMDRAIDVDWLILFWPNL